MLMNFIRRLTTLVSMFAILSTCVLAGTVTYSNSYGPATTDFTHTFTLSQFQPGLSGVPTSVHLTGVSLFLSAGIDVSSLNMANIGEPPARQEDFEAILQSQISSLTNTASLDLVPSFYIDIFDSGVVTLGPAGSGTCPLGTPSAVCSSVFYTPPDIVNSGSQSKVVPTSHWSGYEGSGTFNIDGKTQAFSSFTGGGGNITFFQTTNATLTAAVTYTYETDTIPEPATMALLGSALVGIGLMGRKRFAR